MKRVIGIIICCVLLFSVPGMAFASTDSKISLLNEYMQDDQFIQHYNDNKEDALNMLQIIENRINQIQTGDRGLVLFDKAYVRVTTTLYQQPNDYSCGPTCALMAIEGLGKLNYVNGNTTNDKIATLCNSMGTDSDSGTVVYMLRNGLNAYTDNYSYSYYKGGNLGLAGFRVSVYDSLDNGLIPILQAYTSTLPYYSNSNYGHYIAIEQFDTENELMRLYDCHCNNRFYGIH